MSFGNQPGQVRFTDVTASSGISRQGQSWGATFFDFNGDGLLDLYQNNHQQKPLSLWINQGDGTFIDIADQAFPDGAPGDFHGAIGIDYNNDGIMELFQAAGGDLGAEDDNPNKNNRFFVQQGNRLVDISEQLGINYPLGRGRMPVAFDFNNDSLLDIVYTAPARPDGRSIPTIFLQDGNGNFTDLGTNSGLDTTVPNGTFSLLGDLNGDNRQELIYISRNPKITVYETSGVPLQDITSTLIPNGLLDNVNNIKDIAVADFNGDTFNDLFIIQQGTSSSGFREDNNREGRVKLQVNRDFQGLTFNTAGNISFNFAGDPDLNLPSFFLDTTVTAEDIYIGSGRINPRNLQFTLDSSAATSRGMPSFTPGVDKGVFIGYDTAAQEWTVQVSSNGNEEFNFLYETQQAHSGIEEINFRQNLNGKADILLTYNPESGQFEDSTEAANLDGLQIAGRNVIAADLDNDGDQDLYVVATANSKNLPNELLENLGNGRFRRVPNAAGAAGTDKGIGDTVVVGDYDLDGFLDLYVTNGDALGFDRPFWLDGSNQLFRNQGNGNNSIQIDLVGTTSNRDAVGAKVYITTPDGQRQVREQNGGIHNRGQNFDRIHFGLGEAERIQSIEVIWPDGASQTFTNVEANRVIQITQNRNNIATLFNYDSEVPDLNLRGTTGDDRLLGSEFNNQIEGLAGNDTLKGFKGRDTLIGGTGNDYIVGGGGRDVLIGGAGRDEFVFTSRGQGAIAFKISSQTPMIF
ncbi:MAG: cartilage acidic protein [Acaryochloridaceae cyanobacterium RL_2_7]|nr:cartilage acidic protein [Acaryochloridaceae cyanobacterium RL_2_7]